MSIATSSMLVELNISVWGATKKDNAVTDKVTHDNNAARDAGRWQKNLMVGNDKLKELSDYAASVRTWHNHHTLPWSDKGPRLLATSLFLDYKTELNARRAWFERKRDEFIADYPTFILGVSQGLGSTHNPDDYPSVSELAQKFGFRVVFTPVPESGDFRVDVPQEELAVLRSEYDEAFDTRLAEAMKTPWEQLHKLLTGMSEKLGLEEKTRWYESFVGNAHSLCAMLGHLNITGDPELERARRRLEQAMQGVHIEDLKEDASVRSEVKAKLDKLLGDYNW